MNKDVYKLLAGKGEGSDSELAFVDGKLSHVTKGEHEMIKEKGKLGELLTALFGSGKINEKTGLPGYDIKKWKGFDVPFSKHNKKHNDGTYHNIPGYSEHSLKSEEEIRIEHQQEENIAEGRELLDPASEQNIDPLSPSQHGETGLPKTVGEIEGFGSESYTMEQYKNMTPDEIVEDIFQKEYNGIVPPGYTSEVEFKAELAGRLKNMPQFQEVSKEEKGFAREGFKKDVYELSKPGGVAEKAGKEMELAYGSGMGTQLRTAYGTQKDVTQQFKFAEQGYAEDIYGLEQRKGAEWEKDYTSFLDTLPSAV